MSVFFVSRVQNEKLPKSVFELQENNVYKHVFGGKKTYVHPKSCVLGTLIFVGQG